MVKEEDKSSVLKVAEGKEDLEMIVTRHSQFTVPINFINIYGEQECRVSKEVLKDNWNKVLDVVANIERKGELAVIFGDLNEPLNPKC